MEQSKKPKKEEPGKYPFTRGIHPGMYRDRLMDNASILWIWRRCADQQAL